jgi:competence protein CoiA
LILVCYLCNISADLAMGLSRLANTKVVKKPNANDRFTSDDLPSPRLKETSAQAERRHLKNMLCAIQKTTNTKVTARGVTKSEGPFLCPKCIKELNLRKGQIKIHHFAHKPPVTCNYGHGESEAHRKAKWAVYSALNQRSDVSECELEKNHGEVISDIYVNIRGARIAIELQISTLTIDEIISRTKKYHANGIAVLWLPLFSDDLGKEKYSPKAWEKWLHATYFGRVYYWLADLTVIPVHFDEYKIYIEESSWYSEYGEEQNAGGYERTSKRWRTPKPGKQVNIANDFVIRNRKAWSGGKMNVPEARLLIDEQSKWW